MLSVQEALAAVLRETEPLPVTQVPLNEALGLVLAEPIVSEVDSPPFDKSLMDGFAVRAADLIDGRATLRVLEEVTAGRVPTQPVGPGQATRIMTGAPLPAGADAVVRIEDCRTTESGTVHIATSPKFASGTAILRRGATLRAGDQVLAAGRRLYPQQLGALAEMGRAHVSVRGRPQAAVIATGDELIPIDAQPQPGQIRNSNETMLVAQLQQAGAVPFPLGIARDDRAELADRIASGLRHDLLLLSGGVSEGDLDLVPSVLVELGVRPVFHKVHLKPGKPIWFGVYDRLDAGSERGRCLVFGLPGNPVGSMVCCELFVRAAVRKLMGGGQPKPIAARLAHEFKSRGDRPTYHPARLEWSSAGAVVTPVAWQGSADLRATVDANAMVLFEPGDRTYEAGAAVDAYPWGPDLE